ncbi:hypothetical protein GCM10017691_18890 [Pseudonocardia petroleophila]|uniref:DUF5615 family PIN-like protein n=1 Tax=Pseudonocardia petroleophila TaxID=37331 RepID=A0A7G7MH16_9PSEU|nr:DUF5615 family PIN-like protein [Pseudonocardia petroleophila]QNG52077.1 DUF5615 family PIN-like protein [Pseudonocardia petroleophila]
MKFLVDAQLPARLARFVPDAGLHVVHTSELPEGNPTTDARIAEVADGEGRGANAALLALFEANLDPVLDALGNADFAEPGPDAMVIRRRPGRLGDRGCHQPGPRCTDRTG